jgi:thymidylate synthase
MNQLDLDYQNLLKDILENGIEKNTRSGKVLSVFGRTIRHKFTDGKFPLLTTKKMYFKGIVTELLWFLTGQTNIKYLLENGCHIWDGDAWKNFCNKHYGNVHITKEDFIERIKDDDEFAKTWGDLGPIYGKQWRSWRKPIKTIGDPKSSQQPIDQIANLINDLKTDPDSRRLMVNAWNVGYLEKMTLPPCHYGFQVYTRELSFQERLNYYDPKKLYHNEVDSWFLDELNIPTRAISLIYNTRSQDVPLGTPFNITSYALLLEIIAKMVNMVPDELISNMGDCHIYLNQIDGVKEQLTREPYELPKLVHLKTDDFYKALSEDLSLLTHLDPLDFQVEGYESHPTIKIPLSN